VAKTESKCTYSEVTITNYLYYKEMKELRWKRPHLRPTCILTE
jgi:hypothetical protein